MRTRKSKPSNTAVIKDKSDTLQKAKTKDPQSVDISKIKKSESNKSSLMLQRKAKMPSSQNKETLVKLDYTIELKKRRSSRHKEQKDIDLLDESKDIEETKQFSISKSDYGQPKAFTKHDSKVSQITQWIEITIAELHYILSKEKENNHKIDEEEVCPICRCELYDDIMQMTEKQIFEIQSKQLQDPDTIEVVKFKDWADHFYHKDWCEGFIKQFAAVENNQNQPSSQDNATEATYVKCAVCSKIYGDYIGDSPPGKMTWKYNAKGKVPLEGYNWGSWVINYLFIDGVRNGTNYRGTRRTAYLPDTDEGKEVLLLLIKSFQRKHTFTVGDSVTTGRSNVVVWNSIHHKTNTSGGTASYGYPDPTYLNRVKLELADKGVILEPSDNIKKIKKSGSINIK